MNKAFYFIGASIGLAAGTIGLYYVNLAFWHMVGMVGRWYWNI